MRMSRRKSIASTTTWCTKAHNIPSFFKIPFFDTEVLEYADANKQPFAVMEVVTLSIANLTSPNFVDPVFV